MRERGMGSGQKDLRHLLVAVAVQNQWHGMSCMCLDGQILDVSMVACDQKKGTRRIECLKNPLQQPVKTLQDPDRFIHAA